MNAIVRTVFFLFPLAISAALLSLSACDLFDDDEGVSFKYGECPGHGASLRAQSNQSVSWTAWPATGWPMCEHCLNEPYEPCISLEGDITYMGYDNCVERNLPYFAVITVSGKKTNVHLSWVGRYCSSNLKVRASKTADTLTLEDYAEDKNNVSVTQCSCISPMDVTLDYADYNISVVRRGGYGYNKGEYFYYPASYEE